MKLFIILIIILILLFLPIPLKIKLEYINTNLVIKIYKYTLFSSKNGIENKYLKKIVKKGKSKDEDNLKDIDDTLNLREKKIISYKKLYRNIKRNKFKPVAKITGSFTYGLEDAALCAMLYGLICNIPNILYALLSIPFKVKNLSFNITPNFNTYALYFDITSIFYFNIANIIYMLYLLIISLELKEVSPK